MEGALPQADVLYMTRVQKERFFNEEDYLRLRDFYILTPERLGLLKEDGIVMHPLPRVTEIAYAVDRDPGRCTSSRRSSGCTYGWPSSPQSWG